MDRTSSSSSSMSSASMDDSEREAYGYLGEDEEPEEEEEEEDTHDYDDMPDDDDDDDDDMDEEDEEDEEDDAIFIADNALPSSRFRHEAIPFFRSFTSSANGLPLEHFLTDSPMFVFPPRTTTLIPASEERTSVRSVLLDTWENLPRADIARLATHLGDGSRLPSEALSQISSRLRGGLSAILEPRFILSADPARVSPSSVHPMLCRPPVTPPPDAADCARSLLSALQRNPSFADRVGLTAGRQSPDSQYTDPRLAFADALLLVQRAHGVLEHDGELSRLPSSVAGPSAGVSSMDNGSSTDFASAARDLNREAESLAERLHAASLDRAGEARVVGGQNAGSLTELAELGLMRSVEPLGLSTSAELLSGLMSRNRSPYERLASREREREKVPSGILKRWVYDPPSCGGDSLPAIFDDEIAHRGGRSSGRATGATAVMPLIAPETYESVNQLSTKVIDRLDNLVMELAKIDAKVADREMKEQLRKKAEENKKKRKKRKKTGTGDDDEDGKVEENGTSADDQNKDEEVVENANADSSVESPALDQGASAIDQSKAEEAVQADDEIVVADVEPRANGEPADSSHADNQADTVMNAIEEEHNRTTGQIGNTGANGGTESNDIVQDNVAPTGSAESEVPRNGFSAVAAQRAAAAGISLDAPANENPEVVAAATESTGIDPAFIAALPEDMRAEILNEYYERIHTSNGGQAGTSSSASATTVNQDFLIALPPAVRAEVLELEAEFQSRQQAANRGGNNGGNGSRPNDSSGTGTAAAAEMDNATFLATLAPELREEILLTTGEAFIQSLPPSVAAEARVLRERDASRIRLRLNPDLSVGFDDGRIPSRIRDSRHGQGRQGGRDQPRELPVYRWKKLDKGWLREVPKAEDEPSPILELDGLSSILRMLWLRQGHYGKTCLYQVLRHACKSTQSRLLVLKELINLTVGNSSPNGGGQALDLKSRPETDGSRLHGTVVRRALELLTLLCKNDSVVAETLLGLPRSEEEASRIPEEITEYTPMPQMRSEISLSTLVSLLDAPLFVRSNSHLEQLVGLISTLCQALPGSTFDGSDRNENSFANRRRRMIDRAAFNPELTDPVTFLLDADDDPQPIFQVPVDDDDDSIEDDFESPRTSTVDRAPGGRSARGGVSTGGEGEDSAQDVTISPQYRIPGFRNDDLVALARVLLRQGCSERTYEKVSRSIGILGELVAIRMVFVNSLVTMAVSTGQEVHKEYERVIGALEKSMESQSSKQKRSVVSAFSVASVGSELMLLRVLKSLSALWTYESEENSTRKKCDKSEEENEATKGDTAISSLTTPSTEHRFRPSMLNGLQELWNALDRLLELVSDEAGLKRSKATEGKPLFSSAIGAMSLDRMRSANRSLSPILARLSPMIEAFLVTHSVDESQPTESQPSPPGTPMAVTPLRGSGQSPSLASPSNGKLTDFDDAIVSRGMETQLSLFVEKHRGPINAILRANPPLLESSFKGALKHPQAIDFDNKKAYFRNIIRKRSSQIHAGTIRINVRRERVFDDSYQQLRLRTPDEMKGRLHVQFTGEEGIDAGGVTREWYIILARQIFDPNYVLFTRSAAKSATYQPDKRSYINREHLENFRFVGRIIGKAIYDGQLLDAYFTRSFYKHILDLKPTYHDIEAEDPDYYKSLKWMLENDITGILDYTMSAEYDEFGKQTVIDLMPNGRNIPVTEENKAEYIRLVTEVRMTKSIEKQIAAFKEGFYELIPLDDCKIFNELELELLMSGLPDIDMADLKANVEYTGYTASSPQINWFWRCVSKMNQEDLARLVMFVTGTSKVPLEGFSNLQGMNGLQKFQIHRVAGNTMRLPSAHTCFNQLDLPEYSTAEILSERLLRAVRECSVGFGFA